MSRNMTRKQLISEVKSELRGLHTARDAADDALIGLLGINRTDGRCLDILEREGVITAGRLAEATGLTTGAVTAVLDRLERAGYARRVRDTADRRRVLVEATEKTRRIAPELFAELIEEVDTELGRYTAAELTLLRDFIRRDREINDAQRARLLARAARGR
jgi:DNA-binding MarR family transcriptional regulator